MRAFAPTASDRHRALGILSIAVSLILALLYLPLLQPWYLIEKQRWQLRARLLAAQETLGNAATIDAEFVQRREALLATGTYLPESSIAVANAGVAQRLQQAADESSNEDSVCMIGNRLPVEPQHNDDSCEEVRLQASVQCGGVALQRFLQSIETTTPRLRIERISVALAPNPLGFDKPMTLNQPLDVRFEVVGCLLPAALSGDDSVPRR